MSYRRIVTGHSPEGKSIFVADAAAPRSTAFKHVPGFVTTLAWETRACPPPRATPRSRQAPGFQDRAARS
jgi:hypothetical protein